MIETPGGQPPVQPELDVPAEDQRGCLFALAQLPLVIFLAIIGSLILAAAVHDLIALSLQ